MIRRGYAFVNKTTGVINSICSWADDRDFDPTIPVDPSEEVIAFDDFDNSNIVHNNHKYDYALKTFVEFTPAPIIEVPFIDPFIALMEENSRMKDAIALMQTQLNNKADKPIGVI